MEDIKTLYETGRNQWLQGSNLEALETYRHIIECGHGQCGANMNAAVILTNLGRMDEAQAHFQKAFATCPDDKELLFNYSLHLLSKGEFEQGLALYENRSWNIRPPGTEWDGSKCGKLLVVPEQGNGDMIQFARFLPEARKRCDRLILMCFGPLVRLFESLGCADEVIEFNPGDEFVEAEEGAGGEVPYDRFARMMSLPHLLGTYSIDPRPYLMVDEAVRAKWGSRDYGDKLKVGLCWRGLKRKKEDSAAIDSRRSIPLESFRPVLEVGGVQFYSLQKDADERDERIVDIMGESRDFADTAALMEHLDLVITVDTAVAHLAGGLGKPTWILNRLDSCWRWGRAEHQTVWYDKARLFNQEKMMEWAPVIERVRNELESMVDSRKRT